MGGVIISTIYAYGKVFGMHPRSIKLALSAELVSADSEEIDVMNYFDIYNSFAKTGLNHEEHTVVPAYYWIQKIKEINNG